MDKNEKLQSEIAEAVAAFAKCHIPITPRSVSVGIYPHCVVATLRGIVAPAEKSYAEDEKSCKLFEEFYDNIFNAKKKILQVAVENILGQLIRNSILWIDPKSGDGVIMFTFAR